MYCNHGRHGMSDSICETIVEKGGAYVFALKGNQGIVHEDVAILFEDAQAVEFQNITHDYHKTENKGHGCIEIRQCWTISDPEYLNYIRNHSKWAQLNTIVMITSERRCGEEVTIETRYFITSLTNDAK